MRKRAFNFTFASWRVRDPQWISARVLLESGEDLLDPLVSIGRETLVLLGDRAILDDPCARNREHGHEVFGILLRREHWECVRLGLGERLSNRYVVIGVE